MKLIAIGFSANNTLQGTLIAADDNDDPLGWESEGNWSSPRFQKESVSQLVAATGINEDRARALIFGALRDARRMAGIPALGDNRMQPEHELPRIVISNRQAREIEADAWSVLSSTNDTPEFFSLGSTLVHLKRGQEGVSLHPLTLAGLRGHLKNLADFVRLVHGAVGLEEKPAEVPRTMVEDMLAVEQPPLPAIVGVSQTPVVIQPGRLLDTEGYHPESGLYMVLTGQNLSVPDSPSREEVAEALNLILGELLVDFPFTSQADRAHAVCALLTPIVRPYIEGPTPLFLIEAPCEGSGKGLFCGVLAQVATGGHLAVMTEGESEDEWRKRITSTLKAAPNLVCIDNVTLRLKSAALSSALTARIWEDREMGYSRNLRLPVRCTWLATANNPVTGREIARRTVRIRIDARVAIPWELSDFRNDLEGGWALSHRGEILSAYLTLVKAWLAAGKPGGEVRMGSFQEWADCLGGILAVAGIDGFLANRQEVYALAELEDEAWLAFFESWWEEWRDQRVGVDLLFDLATERGLLVDLRGGRSKHGARVAMGKELMARRDRRQGNFIIRLAGSAHGVQHYRLENVEIKTLVAEDLKLYDGQEKTNQTNQTNLPPEADGGGSGGSGGFIPDPPQILVAAGDTTSHAQRSAHKLDLLLPCPTAPCPVCGSMLYYFTGWNQWLCSGCHPKPGISNRDWTMILDSKISMEDRLRALWPDSGPWMYVSPLGRRTMVMEELL